MNITLFWKKNHNQVYLWINRLKSYSLFLLYVQIDDYQTNNIESMVLPTCFYLI